MNKEDPSQSVAVLLSEYSCMSRAIILDLVCFRCLANWSSFLISSGWRVMFNRLCVLIVSPGNGVTLFSLNPNFIIG